MSDLVARVTERLDELERVAEAATPGSWFPMYSGTVAADRPGTWIMETVAHTSPADNWPKRNADHIALNDPDQTKRLVAGLRAVVGMHVAENLDTMLPENWCEECLEPWPCPTLTALASIWEAGS